MPPPKRATIADIAARAGVSVGAVSFALNDRPGVSDDTRARIRAIAREMKWHPHSAARALGGARANSIGFVLNRPARSLGTDSFFVDLISGIQLGLSNAASARGESVHIGMNLLIAKDLREELDTYNEWWSGCSVDGVIVVDPRVDDPRLVLLDSLGLSAVVVGSHPSAAGAAPAAWIDDAAAADILFGYLHALGHSHIAHISGPREFEHTAMRAAALQKFQSASPRASVESFPTDYSAEAGASITRTLLSRSVRPTALVYDNDVLAVAGLGVASEMGLSVPRDLSIASFDDSAMARLVRPSLTTLTRDTVQLGEIATLLLLEQIESRLPLPSREALRLTLSVRESTAPPS